MKRQLAGEVADAADTLEHAIREAFADTFHIHRISASAAELVVAEIRGNLLRPKTAWALKALGNHLAPGDSHARD